MYAYDIREISSQLEGPLRLYEENEKVTVEPYSYAERKKERAQKRAEKASKGAAEGTEKKEPAAKNNGPDSAPAAAENAPAADGKPENGYSEF